jgi:hypothetical protein
MLKRRPLICKLGFHKWAQVGGKTERCQRAGCHRARIDLCGHIYAWDQILCSCGAEIVPIRENFWRVVNTGEVCNGGHWHEPAV